MVEPFKNPIYVTRPFLPPLKDFCKGLEEVWDSRWLTNNGPVVTRYAQELRSFLAIDNVCLFNNGTLALQIGLQGLGISGEVITTPFSFVATTHALYWNKIRPVFVDIEPDFYTIDPEKIEEAITPWTTAILAVHVFGNPCNHDILSEIAKKHNLRLIYDAAHAFGVQINGKSIAHYGDLSMFSFHATKLYHSFEGGLLTFNDAKLTRIFDYLKNFGFENEVEVVMPGTNAKMTEVQALMGSILLPYLDKMIQERESIYHLYCERLKEVAGIRLPIKHAPSIQYNYAYMPVEIEECRFGMSRDQLYEKLKEYNIYARRYFYPLICDFPCYKNIQVQDPLRTARNVASHILTLPIYAGLSPDEVNQICDIIIFIQKNH
ncbi:MAG: DegT/DnrJ/EryC1/StrS family aminotransferase [Phycisphaerae bacterium]|nr:DegT/DnrJ/EryC1/StrS family aminotransferase [Phycisphaerae bacterium]